LIPTLLFAKSFLVNEGWRVLAWLFIAILNPIVEEGYWRATLMDAMPKRTGFVSILYSAFWFGLSHPFVIGINSAPGFLLPVVELSAAFRDEFCKGLRRLHRQKKLRLVGECAEIDMEQHIALATIAEVDVLVSWNFKHIVQFFKIRQFNAINLSLGYKTIQIFSPREVSTYEEE
jgi:hypothetical protein